MKSSNRILPPPFLVETWKLNFLWLVSIVTTRFCAKRVLVESSWKLDGNLVETCSLAGKRSVILCFFVLVSVFCKGQTNLVVNPSFEIYTTCPDGIGMDLNSAFGWDSSRASPDYFHFCATSSYVQIPKNYFGYQTPASGNAYSGIWCYASSSLYREIMIGTLTTPLLVSEKYYFSIKANKADSNFVVGYSVNKLGIKLSKVKQSNVPINNNAHFFSNSVITDTTNWTTLFGSFVADSTYQYIMIGGFFDDGNITIVNDGTGSGAYYFIDDICVSTDSAFAYNYSYSNGIADFHQSKPTNIFPNPTKDNLFVQNNKQKNTKAFVINSAGETIITLDIPANSTKMIDCFQLSNGIYFLHSENYSYKFIVQH